jgi:hypothetical protein
VSTLWRIADQIDAPDYRGRLRSWISGAVPLRWLATGRIVIR